MVGILKEDRVLIKDEKRASRLQQRGFGRRKEGILELSLIEGLYLLEKGTIEIKEGRKKFSFETFLETLREEGLYNKYMVYRDLRERGYVVKTGFKFGAHFRVYARGEGLQGHSRMLVHVETEDSAMGFPEVSRAVRLAQGVKKEMVFAVIDGDGDITYYKVDRITP
jgi:tRNA-intron endonuclease